MGSTMSTMPSKQNQSGLFGGSKPVPVWLQFVPGVVLDVVINSESPAYESDRDINSILAKSHISPTNGIKLKGVWPSGLSKKQHERLAKTIQKNPPKK